MQLENFHREIPMPRLRRGCKTAVSHMAQKKVILLFFYIAICVSPYEGTIENVYDGVSETRKHGLKWLDKSFF